MSLRCAGCGAELAPGMLACPACRKLVHGDRLRTLAADAEAAEKASDFSQALQHWRSAHELLPPESQQHRIIGDTIQRLSQKVDQGPQKSGGKTMAGLGVVGVMLWKLKFVLLSLLGKAKLVATGLTSLPTLLSMLGWVALDRSRGLTFALGILVSIYIHEMGHVSALRLYGIKATAPMFVPGFGALVRLKQYPIDAREDARVGLAGPIWGCAAAVMALVPGLLLHEPTLLAIAAVGATINLFNLVPFWQLDGARGFRALDQKQRGIVVALAGVVALVFEQPMGWIICAVGAFRMRNGLPPQGDGRGFRAFLVLLGALSAISWWGSMK